MIDGDLRISAAVLVNKMTLGKIETVKNKF